MELPQEILATDPGHSVQPRKRISNPENWRRNVNKKARLR
ncbi:unnamed protein product, partial [Allacma fusca]